MENEIGKIQNKVLELKLVISRLPRKTKDDFIALANAEFCGDYGMTLKYLFDNFKLWKLLFENIDMKLDQILEVIPQTEQKPDKEEIQLLSGKRIESKGGEKNGKFK